MSEDYVLEEVLADYYAGIDIYAGTENAQKDVEARGRTVRETVGSRGEARSEEAGGETRASRDYAEAIDLLDRNEMPIDTDTHIQDMGYPPKVYIDRANAKNRRMVMS